MDFQTNIPYPVNFNPLKHHLGYIRSFTVSKNTVCESEIKLDIVPLLRHIGNSVADIYTGELDVADIVNDIEKLIKKENIATKQLFIKWINETGRGYRKIELSDSSQWVVKYLNDKDRYFHIFPGRNIEHTTRSRGNSLKTSILFNILFDKGDIILSDLNNVRKMLSLSPLANTSSAGSIISNIRLIQA